MESVETEMQSSTAKRPREASEEAPAVSAVSGVEDARQEPAPKKIKSGTEDEPESQEIHSPSANFHFNDEVEEEKEDGASAVQALGEQKAGATKGKISAWEEEVGISVFLGRSPPWIGVVKHRFTDFQVAEVALDGQVVHLTDLTSVPSVPSDVAPADASATSAAAAATQPQLNEDEGKSKEKEKEEEESAEEAEAKKKAEEEEAQRKRVEEEEAKAKEEAERLEKDQRAEAEARAALAQLLGDEQTAKLFEWIQQVKSDQEERIKQQASSSSSSASSSSASSSSTAEQESEGKNERGGRWRGGRGGGRGGRGGRGGGRGGGGGGRDGGVVEHKELKLAASDDKVHRTEVHKAFRQHFEGFLDTKTQDDSVVVMVVGRADRRGRPRTGGRSDAPNQRQWQWPSCWGDYLRFVLYKENKDTIATVTLLAKFTNARANRFTYAGTKDKRGVTTQHMTIYRMRAEQLRGLNAKLYGVRVGNFSYVTQPLRLGDLFGNRFSIILREVSASEEEINESLTELRRTGFINYYGLQRFGTSSVATHRVGIALLQGKWQEATTLILQPRHGEEAECEGARKYWAETGDIGGTLRKMPRQLHVERLLIQGFQKMGKSQHLVAFQTLPRNLRMLYPHSYQSYVWNCMATERVRKYGADKPVVGDLVLLDGKGRDVAEPMDEVTEDKLMEEEDDKEAEIVEEEETANAAKLNVKVLTEEDLPDYTIDDVVLPLPGYQTKYPENEMGAAYVRLLAEQGLTVRDFRLPGSYRRLLARPIDLEWDFSYFDDPSVDLLQTDLYRLEGKAPPPSLPTGRYRAVKVSFTLGSSSYATMLLREMMKQESSIDVQKRLYAAQRERHATK